MKNNCRPLESAYITPDQASKIGGYCPMRYRQLAKAGDMRYEADSNGRIHKVNREDVGNYRKPQSGYRKHKPRQKKQQPEGYITSEEAKKITGYSEQYIISLGRKGTIRRITLGQTSFFSEDDVEKYAVADLVSRPKAALATGYTEGGITYKAKRDGVFYKKGGRVFFPRKWVQNMILGMKPLDEELFQTT